MGAPNLWVAINLYKNNVFQLSHVMKNHLSKQVVSVIDKLGKNVFGAAAF